MVMALRKWAGYIALHPVTVCTDHQSLQLWHKEHVDTPSGPASRRARWHETLAKFDLTVVYVPGKDNTVADCLSRWAYPASKGMTDVSAHGDEAETAEAKRIIEMERLMEEEGVKCFVVMAADAPLGTRMGRAVRVLAPDGAESDKHLFPESCLQDDWTDDYAKSEAFAAEYRAVTDPDDGQKWPKGLTEEDGKLSRNGKLLVPESRVLELCEAWHHHMMHPGVKNQALDMQRRFEIDQINLYTAIKKVRKGCSVCQACNPDNRNVKGEAQWTPVPDQPMESVAMDVFSMPEVHIGKETFDCVVLCVDRHSGYVVAVPARKKGLLAKEVAVMMIRHWLTVFDIPRTICSDRGPQFTGGWFKAMCSLMGIRHAKSVAYRSRSNGRAEVAGRQLLEKLRKIHITDPRRNWFEEMWPVLKAHHDTPTPGGSSPHQILFGRDPLSRGLPLSGDGMAMDAKEFFARQQATARDIRQQLEKEHAERQKSAPSSTAQKFRVGDPVWVIRPRPMGTHRTKTWVTHPERWSAGLVRTPTISRWVTDSSGSATRVNSVCGNPTSVASMCPWTILHMRLIRTTTMLSRTTIQLRRSWPSVRTPRHPEVWSSRFVGEAMGRPTTPGNPSPRSCRGLILHSWTTSASTRPRSTSRTWQHSPRRLQPGVPDQRPELSPDAF